MSSAIHGGGHWQPNIQSVEDYGRIVAADVNDAWYSPAPAVLEAIAEWSRYVQHSPDTSCRALQTAISRHFKIAEQVVRIGAGSSDLIHHFVTSVVEPGAEVLTLSPTYAEYARAAACAGAAVRVMELDPGNDFQVEVSKLLSAVRPQTRLVALCNPNNPTGSVLHRRDLLRFIAGLTAHTLVLVDEAYIDFTPEESVFTDTPSFPNLAVVRTFSKAFAMAGLRVGYAAMGERAAALADANPRPPWPVGLLSLNSATIALEQQTYVQERIAEYSRLKTALMRTLAVECIPSQTHYFLLDLEKSGVSASDLLARLRERNVFLREFSTFCDFLPQRFVRITTQSEQDNFRIAQAVNQELGASTRSVPAVVRSR